MYSLLPNELWDLTFDFLPVSDIKSVMSTCKLLHSLYWGRVFSKAHKVDTLTKWYPNMFPIDKVSMKGLSYAKVIEMASKGEVHRYSKRKDFDKRFLLAIFPNGFDKNSVFKEVYVKVPWDKIRYSNIYPIRSIQARLRKRLESSYTLVEPGVWSNPYIPLSILDNVIRGNNWISPTEVRMLLRNKALTKEHLEIALNQDWYPNVCIEHPEASLNLILKGLSQCGNTYLFPYIQARLTDDELLTLVNSKEFISIGRRASLHDTSALSYEMLLRLIQKEGLFSKVHISSYHKLRIPLKTLEEHGVLKRLSDLAFHSNNVKQVLTKRVLDLDDVLLLIKVWSHLKDFWVMLSSNPSVTFGMIKAYPDMNWSLRGLLINPSISLKDMFELINLLSK